MHKTPHQKLIKEARVALREYWSACGEVEVGTGASPRVPSTGKADPYAFKSNGNRLDALSNQSPLAMMVAQMVTNTFTSMSVSAGVERTQIQVNEYFKRTRQELGDAILNVIERHEP